MKRLKRQAEDDMLQQIDDKIADACIELDDAIKLAKQNNLSDDIIDALQGAIDDLQGLRDDL